MSRYRRGWLLSLLAVLWLAPVATAGDTKMMLDIGWGERTRVGAWTPVYVEVTDPKPRNAVLEYVGAFDSSTSLKIQQDVAIGPQSGQKYLLLVPLVNSWNDVAMVRVRDAATGKVLVEEPILDQMNGTAPSKHAQLLTNFVGPFIGVSGRGPALNQIMTGGNGPAIGFLRPLFLPRTAEGYSALNVLVLNQPDFNTLEAVQQKAIADWVRSGGHLVLWPSDDPLPPVSPLVSLLPCKVGDIITVKLSKEDQKAAGLYERFATFKARQLSPAEDAVTLPLLGKSGAATGAVAVRGRVGVGRVTVVSFEASGLTFGSSETALQFWARVLDPNSRPTDSSSQQFLKGSEQSNNSHQTQEPSQAQAAGQVMDLLGEVPGVGTFGFGYVATVLLAMMVIVGPVDWFILKKLGRQPWTWVTTSGWIGLISMGAISIGSIVRSGDLHLRTLRLIDQADDHVYARHDVVGIYSPRTTDYKLDAAPGGWWRPLSTDQFAYGRSISRPIEFLQDARSNVPLPMTINVWNLRFLQAQTYERGAAVVGASLTLQYEKLKTRGGSTQRMPHLTGTITNQSGLAWSHVWIRTPTGVFELTPLKTNDAGPGGAGSGLAPKATMPVDLVVEQNDQWTRDQGPYRYTRYGQQVQILGDSPLGLIKAAGRLDQRRDAAMTKLLEHDAPAYYSGGTIPAGSSVAAVYALCDAAPAAVKLADQQPIEKHWQVVRAVVNVQHLPAGAEVK